MQKILKISVILQIIYCVGCLVVLLCMLLHGILPSEGAAKAAFDVGTVFFFLSILNPCGVICSFIANPMIYMLRQATPGTAHSKFKLWLFLAPVLVVLCWFAAVISFVKTMNAN